ncbi:hypothetical protein SAMN06298221_11499 [Sphaerochaeta associata]|nr:hypothetical protein SAMN06298221_1111 [Sphaerochaeta associata]SMP62651.1 hypothetical protein SAMN06298221_11499 [Sphaerochaeta associata]
MPNLSSPPKQIEHLKRQLVDGGFEVVG